MKSWERRRLKNENRKAIDGAFDWRYSAMNFSSSATRKKSEKALELPDMTVDVGGKERARRRGDFNEIARYEREAKNETRFSSLARKNNLKQVYDDICEWRQRSKWIWCKWFEMLCLFYNRGDRTSGVNKLFKILSRFFVYRRGRNEYQKIKSRFSIESLLNKLLLFYTTVDVTYKLLECQICCETS